MLTSLKDKIWYEKYRPKNFSEYVFQDEQTKQKLLKYIETQDIPHLLLSGNPGSGKTTLVRILKNELNIDDNDFLYINASKETSVDTIRDKVIDFISTISMGDFKLVHLEEADRISTNGQDALKAITEDYASVARFVLTTNRENKIIPALHSRLTHFRFKTCDKEDITFRIAKILKSENIKTTIEILDQYVDVCFPDIRKTISRVQENCIEGVLQPFPKTIREISDYQQTILECIERDDWISARKTLTQYVSNEDWEDIYRMLYDNLDSCGKFKKDRNKWESGIVAIAEHLYKDTLCADREINAVALFIKLSHI